MVRRNSGLTGPTKPYGLAGALKIGTGGKSSCPARLSSAKGLCTESPLAARRRLVVEGPPTADPRLGLGPLNAAGGFVESVSRLVNDLVWVPEGSPGGNPRCTVHVSACKAIA